MAQEVAGSIPVGHPELKRSRRGRDVVRRPPGFLLLILALVVVGAGLGFAASTWWIGTGTGADLRVPAQIEPVVTSPALTPRATPQSEYRDVDLAVPVVDMLAPPPPRQPTVAVEETLEHVVQAGESLSYIAALYGVGVDEIAAANNIADVSVINIGQVLLIPGSN